MLKIGIESNGDITVNFPEQNRWTGLLAEMERVESEANTGNPVSPILGPFDSATVAVTLQGFILARTIHLFLMAHFFIQISENLHLVSYIRWWSARAVIPCLLEGPGLLVECAKNSIFVNSVSILIAVDIGIHLIGLVIQVTSKSKI